MLLLERDSDEERESALLNTSSEVKHRRTMEKQQRKFQKLSEKQNVQEYQENFKSKNYTTINSKVEKLRFKKWESSEEAKVSIKDKVLINRRVLNDYIHIVNKRQDEVDSMEENFWTMVQLYDGTLHYFNKYYGKNLEDQIEKLKRIIKPEHHYLLKTIDKNEGRIKRRIQEFLSVRNTTDPRLRKAFEECQNIEEIVHKNQEAVRQRMADRRNQNKTDGHIEKLQKKKGYIINEMSVEQVRQNQMVMNEVQKFGSDRIKRQLFVQDMKSIIENKEIQDKIHKIQQQMDKIQSNQPNSTTPANPNTNQPASIEERSNSSDQNSAIGEQQEQNHSFNHLNPKIKLQSLQHLQVHSPKQSFRSKSPSLTGLQLPQNIILTTEPDSKTPSKSSFFKRRHSHNSLNPFLILNSQDALEQLREQNVSTFREEFNASQGHSIQEDSGKLVKSSLHNFTSHPDLTTIGSSVLSTNQIDDSCMDPTNNPSMVSTPHKGRNLVASKSGIFLPKPLTPMNHKHQKVKSVVSFALPKGPSTLLSNETQITHQSSQHQITSPLSQSHVTMKSERLKSFLSSTATSQPDLLNNLGMVSPNGNTIKQEKGFQIKTLDRSGNSHSMRKASLETLIGAKPTMNQRQSQRMQSITFFSPVSSVHQQAHQLQPLKPAIRFNNTSVPTLVIQQNGEPTSITTLDQPDVSSSHSILISSPEKTVGKKVNKLSSLISKNSNSIDSANNAAKLSKQSTRSFQENPYLQQTQVPSFSEQSSQQQIIVRPALEVVTAFPAQKEQKEAIASPVIKIKPTQEQASPILIESKQGSQTQIAAPLLKRNKKALHTSLTGSEKKEVVVEKKEKPLIRDKIYNETDIFKYKKINQYVIQEYYEKKILNVQKDEIPLLTAAELLQIEEDKLNKNPAAGHSKQAVSANKDLFWNNVEEKKADFLGLEKERVQFISLESEAVVSDQITRIHGSVISDLYKDIQNGCSAQIEDSKTFSKDIREGEKEIVSDHKKLKSEYISNLGPKVYKSIYVEQILNQTKKQLNIKLRKKHPANSSKRSLSPEKILSNLLKKDKKIQAWGKNLSKTAQSKEGEKKYSIIATGLQTRDEQKKKVQEESTKEIAKYIDKVNSTQHAKSLKEQLEQLMNLDSQRKAMFQMTQGKIVGQNPQLKFREKNKYLQGVLSGKNGGGVMAASKEFQDSGIAGDSAVTN